MSIAEYYDGSDLLNKDHGGTDYFRISPSSISKFFSSTTQWYREHLLGEGGFEGSTASITGTIVHYFAEMAALDNIPASPDKVVEEFLDAQTIEFDRGQVELHWKDLANVLNASCVYPHLSKIHSTEAFIYQKVLPGIYVAGTYDALLDNFDGTYTIRDYKTSSQKPSGFSYDYKLQALTYAWILTQQGKHISEVELQYVVKPTKTLPVRHFQFKHQVTPEDLEFIGGIINLIGHSIDTWNKQPELRYLLAQDIRLRASNQTPSILFKD